jgi:hypothetical protein
MKLTGEIGEEVPILKSVLAGQSRIFEEASFVKGHLCNWGFKFHACVPGTALRTVKSTAVRTVVGKRSVDDVGFRNTIQ